MFRATICPSSGEITVSVWRLLFATLCGWLSGMHTRQSSTQSDKYQVSHTYGYFFWWWAHSHPKHQKRNKEINIIKKIVNQVGFIYKIIQGCTVNNTQNTVYRPYRGDPYCRNATRFRKINPILTLFTLITKSRSSLYFFFFFFTKLTNFQRYHVKLISNEFHLYLSRNGWSTSKFWRFANRASQYNLSNWPT